MRSFPDGRYDPQGQVWFVLPIKDVETDPSREAMIVGSAGVDGIEFCFRIASDGLWAYDPIGRAWVQVAQTLAELKRGWLDGSIAV